MSFVLLLLACGPPLTYVDTESTDMPTVVRVNWDAAAEADTFIEYTDSNGVSSTAEPYVGPDGDWEALLFGSPRADVSFDVWVDGQLAESGTASTGSEKPDVATDEAIGTFYTPFVTTLQEDESWSTVLLDEAGNVRWFDHYTDDTEVMLRSRPVEDGIWLAKFSTTTDELEAGVFTLLGWDGMVLEQFDAPQYHHDFYVHDDGSMTWIAWDEYEQGGDTSVGDALWHRTAEGEVTELCKIRDLVPEVAANRDPGSNWAWGNHIEFDGENYWVSFNRLSAYLLIDPDGNLVGEFGFNSEITDPSIRPEEIFVNQHGGNFGPDGDTFMVFDNQGADQGMRVLEFAIDGAGDAPLVWSKASPPNWESPALGDARRFDDDTVLISWGVFGMIEQVDDAGATVASLDFEDGSFVGYLSPTALPLSQ